MNMFLTTVHGILMLSYSDTENYPFQGMIQGNRAASPAWIIVAIIIILYLHRLQLVPTLVTPITKEEFQLIVQLFMDNTNLNIKKNGKELEQQIIDRVQRILTA